MPKEKKETSQEYQLMVRLEQLESLREDMAELEVTTLAEVEQRIAELHRQLDDMDTQG